MWHVCGHYVAIGNASGVQFPTLGPLLCHGNMIPIWGTLCIIPTIQYNKSCPIPLHIPLQWKTQSGMRHFEWNVTME
jgi:hypothetical protein